ncbi:MAG: Crp/Fnr family transcriptional regulator [Oscillospiraceae bacterium]|nr:Crp/Fnr family transcriptional regulator [Oscillospiraceae bacterium]
MEEQNENRRILSRHFAVWDKLSEKEQDQLVQYSSLVRYAKGAHIHNAEEHCIGVILVKRGVLRIYMLSEEGKEITLYRLYANDVCSLSASCVLDGITFDVDIDAEEDSEVLLIGASVFADLIQQNGAIESYIYKLATERFSDVMWAMQQILFMSFDKRLAIFLFDELSKSRDNVIRMTHEQIARYMGSAREVVTRMLKYFANEGIVELSRGSIKIMDKEKLRGITENGRGGAEGRGKNGKKANKPTAL